VADFHALDPAELSQGAMYDLMVAAIQPRPIAFVSTECSDGHANLAPFSFFMPGGVNPPSLAFSPTRNAQGEEKDTLKNIRDTGEFVVNILDRSMAEGMNQTAFGYPRGYEEWPVSGFSPIASAKVKPRRVAESLVQFECRLYQIVAHGEGPNAGAYVIGEIVCAHVSPLVWHDGAVVQGVIRPIGRLGGPQYVDLASMELFELARPSGPKP
jgi:flavin reductase (DIM6/NTAB) family NADH-FMN oxidoreductase RutF